MAKGCRVSLCDLWSLPRISSQGPSARLSAGLKGRKRDLQLLRTYFLLDKANAGCTSAQHKSKFRKLQD